MSTTASRGAALSGGCSTRVSCPGRRAQGGVAASVNGRRQQWRRPSRGGSAARRLRAQPRQTQTTEDVTVVSSSESRPGYSKSFFNLKAQPDGLVSLKKALELDGIGLAIVNFAPGQGYTFTHSQECQEEIYICVQGKGLMQLDHEVLSMEPGDIVRVSPQTRRSVYANPCSKIGYSMKSDPENFVLYVVGAVPAARGLGGGEGGGAGLVDDGIPHFDDVPTWFRDNTGILDRNAMLKERFDRIRAYNREKQSTHRPRAEKGCISELHRTKFLNDVTKGRGESEAGAEGSAGGGGGGEGALSSQLSVYSALVDATKKKILLTRTSPPESGAEGEDLWEMPGGQVLGGELPEEALSRNLKESLGIEAHHESFESFCFFSNNDNTVHLVYTCDDWCGEPQDLLGNKDLVWLSHRELKGRNLSKTCDAALPRLKTLMSKRVKSA